MSDPIIHFQRLDGLVACRVIRIRRRNALKDLPTSSFERQVTCRLCRKTIAFKNVFPYTAAKKDKSMTENKGPIIAQVNAACSGQIRRLTFLEKNKLHNYMAMFLGPTGTANSVGKPYHRYVTGYSDKAIFTYMQSQIDGLKPDHVANHRLECFGPLEDKRVQAAQEGSYAELKQKFDRYVKETDHELELIKKAMCRLARQLGVEPTIKEILDE